MLASQVAHVAKAQTSPHDIDSRLVESRAIEAVIWGMLLQFYLMTIKDKDGNSFDGGNTYRLTVPANAPVKL